ncbi:MAG: phosphonate C-P lyase system protein PhnL [Ottowia sp.]|uniref:phosphonate C-P lyase system protein PhnL n=1 Tax=Ottowia sp. TaxID=1898956 RepID=UPI003C732D05
MTSAVLSMTGVGKSFTLHHQSGTELPVLSDVDLEASPGECLVLDGPSGMGKSTLLKLVYANYLASAGRIRVRGADGEFLEVTEASARDLVRMRRDTVGYVSQFLRVIPRVSALDVVAEPLMEGCGADPEAVQKARDEAAKWLERLRIPQRLWALPPATFSGGEQQRINIARSLIKPRPLLLVDEPTASLDAANTRTVVELIQEAMSRGSAVLGIFHDQEVGAQVATRFVDMSRFRRSA